MPRNYRHDPAARAERRVPKPLDPARMEEMALAYVARFATSAGKLGDYLKRKLRERGWEGEGACDGQGPDIAALVERFVALGYVDDATFARAKAQGLLRRGYGARRIDQALGAAGIAETLREESRGNEADRRSAALVMARKRRFGPFGAGGTADRALREKQVAAMLRAGHPLDHVREVVNALSEQALEEWVDEARD
ncbi:MAG: hypothetical protein C0409_10030 [Novosphingobium sp.]|nr:hypothetical protein [Novosphingobium sp.]